MNPLTASIDLKVLTFADWVLIAQSWNQDAKWGFYRWRDSVASETLKGLSLEQWEAIADEIGWSGAWAYKQFKEYSAVSV